MSSKRGYLDQTELAQFADITITDATEADDQISMAEEMIDGYIGYTEKAVCDTIYGRVAAGGSNNITLEAGRHQNVFYKDYFKGCYVEIVGGTNAGQRFICTGSTFAGVLTVEASWTSTPDTTSYYKIYQLGKFPRIQDQYFDGNVAVQVYVRAIPEAIKRATAAQVEYIITMGAAYFSSNESELMSESIGDYAYRMGREMSGYGQLIAPKAKTLLRGYINRKGQDS